jgi:hypothetical protein
MVTHPAGRSALLAALLSLFLPLVAAFFTPVLALGARLLRRHRRGHPGRRLYQRFVPVLAPVGDG